MTRHAITGVFLLAMAATGQAQQRETKTEIGSLSTFNGRVSLSVTARGSSKQAAMFVSDRHVVSTNLIVLSAGQLKQLRALIDETLDEVEPGWNNVDPAAAEIARVVSEAGRLCKANDAVDLACAGAVSACGRSSTTKAAAEQCVAAVQRPAQR